MRKIFFAIVVLFTCTSINIYEPKKKNIDFEIYEIKQEVKQLYNQGKLSQKDIDNLINILE